MEGLAPISKGDYAIKLLTPGGVVQNGSFHLEDLGGSCKLTLTFNDQSLSAMSWDFFDALAQIRRRLEKDGLLPFCYGASRNVYHTDVSRAMAQGLMAPRWESGKRIPGDLVFIFHSGPDVEPVTVAEQRECHQRRVAGYQAPAATGGSIEPQLAA
jgi:hypothetical protein